MAGHGRPRRRRASDSTVETVDYSRVRWVKESSVLRRQPPTVSDNDWPCYVLTDATIYRKDGKTLANPLLVHAQGPLVVRGFLEVDEDDLIPYLVRPSLKSAYIEIPHSDRYSIGDGPLALWVSGASGWFEIRPSLEYMPMYNQIREAITLYYGVFDVYEAYEKACGHKKKANWPKPPTLDQVFLKYAVKAGDGILRDEVEALCHKWAEFLLAHFPKEAELDWDQTLFANWLRDSHPDLVKKVADAANGVIPPVPPPETQNSDEEEGPRIGKSRSAKTSARNSEVEMVGIRDFALDRSRSPQTKPPSKGKAKMIETPVPLPERYRQISQPATSKESPAPRSTSKHTPMDTPVDAPVADVTSESPVDRLLGVLQEIAGEVDIKKTPQSKLHSILYFKCRIKQYGAAREIVAYYAKGLLPRLGPEWKGTPWYEWLKETAKQPFKPPEHTTVEDIPSQTVRRAKMAKAAPSTAAATQLPPPINLKAGSKQAATSQSEDDSDEDVLIRHTPPRTGGRKSGKAASLRLASSSKKRPPSDPEELESEYGRGRKSAKTVRQTSDDDENLDGARGASDDEVDDDDEDTAAGSRLPVPEGAVRVVVRAERIPSMTPTGPNGTWICDQEGCGYVVRSAEDEDSQELIAEHFRDHEAQAEKITLAVKESRGHMPISNLLDKIQAIGKAALLKKQQTVNGQPVPAPIKRRMLI
ncbi:hypothetical protein VTK56DRAFT_3161 [Thermocarpiscus australiensis]